MKFYQQIRIVTSFLASIFSGLMLLSWIADWFYIDGIKRGKESFLGMKYPRRYYSMEASTYEDYLWPILLLILFLISLYFLLKSKTKY